MSLKTKKTKNKTKQKNKTKKQGLLKNWPRVTGPTEHGVFKVIR